MSTVARIRLGALVAVIVALVTVAAVGGADWLLDQITSLGDASLRNLAVFVVLYAVATVLLVPGTASTAVAGALFGPVVGAGAAIVGATFGATGSYAISRLLGRAPVASAERGRLRLVDGWLAQRQFRSILVLRLLPIVPFNGLNYAAGLTAIRPLPYIAGTAIGITPGAYVLARVGDAAATDLFSFQFAATLSVAVIFVVLSAVVARRWIAKREATVDASKS